MAGLNNRMRQTRRPNMNMSPKDTMKMNEKKKEDYINILHEKWKRQDKKLTQNSSRKIKSLDELRHENPTKFKNLMVLLENQEEYARQLKEADNVSTNYAGLTPEHMVKIFRYAYTESIGSDIVVEYPMATANDSMYFIEPVASSAKRGSDTSTMVFEKQGDYGYPKDITYEKVATGNGSTANYTGTLTVKPILPGRINLIAGNTTVGWQRIAIDDGDGAFTSVGSNYPLSSGTASTIDYDSGAWDITFDSNLTNLIEVYLEVPYDNEDSDLYTQQGGLKLEVKQLNFQPRLQSLGLTWSFLSDFVFSNSYGTNQKDVLIESAMDYFRKASDDEKIARLARLARNNDNTGLTFDTDWASSSASSEKMYAQSLKRIISKAGNKMQDTYNRGFVNRIICANDAADYVGDLLDGFIPESGERKTIGAYKMGNLDGVPVYRSNNVGTAFVNGLESGEILVEYVDFATSGDSALVYGTYGGMVETPTNTYKNFQSEKGLGQMTDVKAHKTGFVRKIQLQNL